MIPGIPLFPFSIWRTESAVFSLSSPSSAAILDRFAPILARRFFNSKDENSLYYVEDRILAENDFVERVGG